MDDVLKAAILSVMKSSEGQEIMKETVFDMIKSEELGFDLVQRIEKEENSICITYDTNLVFQAKKNKSVIKEADMTMDTKRVRKVYENKKEDLVLCLNCNECEFLNKFNVNKEVVKSSMENELLLIKYKIGDSDKTAQVVNKNGIAYIYDNLGKKRICDYFKRLNDMHGAVQIEDIEIQN